MHLKYLFSFPDSITRCVNEVISVVFMSTHNRMIICDYIEIWYNLIPETQTELIIHVYDCDMIMLLLLHPIIVVQ